MPTPAVAMLTRSMRADLGVMISASHNPFEDNGIKLFGPDGYKLTDDDRARDRGADRRRHAASACPSPHDLGRAKRDRERACPLHRIRQAHPAAALSLDGPADGASIAPTAPPTRSRPRALWELGAEVFAIGVEPDGFNINRDVGSTAPGRAGRQGARAARRHRHRARRRRRPGADRRREGPRRRRRPADGRRRADPGRRTGASPAGHRRHRHVQSRPRALSRRPRA